MRLKLIMLVNEPYLIMMFNYWYIAGLSVVAVVVIVSPLDGPLGDVTAIGALSGALSQ